MTVARGARSSAACSSVGACSRHEVAGEVSRRQRLDLPLQPVLLAQNGPEQGALVGRRSGQGGVNAGVARQQSEDDTGQRGDRGRMGIISG